LVTLDLVFDVEGKEINSDHGYALYSSIAKKVPEIKEINCGVHLIRGVPVGRRKIRLHSNSKLIIRLNHELVPKFLPLAGEGLRLNGETIKIGLPQPKLLKKAENCYSWIVTIKGYINSDTFLDGAKRQLEEAGIRGECSLLKRKNFKEKEEEEKSPYVRRTINIKGREIVGYALKVEKLDPESSLLLQELGLGGRRKMGCGIFNPVGEASNG